MRIWWRLTPLIQTLGKLDFSVHPVLHQTMSGEKRFSPSHYFWRFEQFESKVSGFVETFELSCNMSVASPPLSSTLWLFIFIHNNNNNNHGLPSMGSVGSKSVAAKAPRRGLDCLRITCIVEMRPGHHVMNIVMLAMILMNCGDDSPC